MIGIKIRKPESVQVADLINTPGSKIKFAFIEITIIFQHASLRCFDPEVSISIMKHRNLAVILLLFKNCKRRSKIGIAITGANR